MTLAILGICSALIPFIIYLIKRQLAKNSDPLVIREQYEAETRKLIAAKDAAGINMFLDERLRQISRNTSGHGSGANQSGRESN